MTFLQWSANAHLPEPCRLAFEDVWNALIGGGCSPSVAGRLLSDALDSIPPKITEDEWE